MNSYSIVLLLGIVIVFLKAGDGASREKRSFQEFDSEIEEEKRLLDFIQTNKLDEYLPDVIKNNLPNCKKEGQKCRLVPTCCGENQCYWENGYSPMKAGICVPHVNATQKCQRDENCGDDMICYRGSTILEILQNHVDGVCREALDDGDKCFFNGSCKTKKCSRKFWQAKPGVCEEK